MSRPSSADLTITSVTFGDRPVAERNAALAERLNPGHRARWRLVVNRPVQPADTTGAELFELVDGAALSAEERADPLFRSLHHAKGLNAGMPGVATRYLLLLDADCFIVRPNWIEDVLGHMHAHGLAFFGAPYPPQALQKLRGFPCAVCLFVDLRRVPLDTLDWTPGPGPDTPVRTRAAVRAVDDLLRRAGMAHRTRSGSSRDTGIRVYARYRTDRKRPSGCVTPVMTLRDVRGVLRHPRELALEKLLPDTWCLLPRGPDGFTDRTFASLGAPDVHGQGAEEYVWHDEPFAFHLRGASQRLLEVEGLDAVLAGFPA